MDKLCHFDGISQAKSEDFSSHVFPAMLVYRRFIHPYFNIYDIPNIHISSQSYLLQSPSFLVSLRYSPENQRMSPENQWVGRVTHPIWRTFRTANWHRKMDSKLAKVPVHGTVTAAFPMAEMFRGESGPVFCWDMELELAGMGDDIIVIFQLSRFKSFKHLLLYQTIHEAFTTNKPRCSKKQICSIKSISS